MEYIMSQTTDKVEQELPWHLLGNWAPVFEEIDAPELKVIGEIPASLNGQYIRNGMNPRSGVSDHWFFGNGMLHGITLNEGKASYRNRYVKTPYYEKDMNQMTGMGDLRNSPANTHIIRHAGKVLALEEAHLPWQVDESLNTLGAYDFDGKLKGPMTAHPRICPETGELLFFSYSMIEAPYLTYHRVSADGQLIQTEAIDIPNPVMMHDWNITRHHVIFMDLPLVFDLQAAMSGDSPFGFKPEIGARLGVMPRNGSNADVRWFEVDPCFVFHPMSAFEEDNKIILHVCRQEKAMVGGMDDIYGGEDTLGKLWRWTIDLTSGEVREEQIDDAAIDFPRIDDRTLGLPTRHGYAMGLDASAPSLTFDRYLYKYDLGDGNRQVQDLGKGVHGAEPVFAASSDSAKDDDGFVLSLTHDSKTNKSSFLVLDAQNFSSAPLAIIELPQRIPFGAHGSWLSQN
jgi:carotenoid cleavage dioxygenase-like enzyme